MSTITITTDKRTFINALVALCKSAGILTFKVENAKTVTVAPVAEILAARAKYDSGDVTDTTTFENATEMRKSYGL